MIGGGGAVGELLSSYSRISLPPSNSVTSGSEEVFVFFRLCLSSPLECALHSGRATSVLFIVVPPQSSTVSSTQILSLSLLLWFHCVVMGIWKRSDKALCEERQDAVFVPVLHQPGTMQIFAVSVGEQSKLLKC